MDEIIFREYNSSKDAIKLHRYLFKQVSLEEIQKDDNYFINEPNKYVRFIVEDCIDRSFIGTITLIINEGSATIHSVVVREDCQRKGIATFMFKKLFDFSKKRGIKSLNISTWNTNKKAISFYKKMGFAINDNSTKGEKNNSRREEISFHYSLNEKSPLCLFIIR